jgi:hypothetical protein
VLRGIEAASLASGQGRAEQAAQVAASTGRQHG